MSHHHMTRGDWLRLGAVILVTVGALYLIYPFWPLGDVVRLGLDLQGGVRMVLEAEAVADMDSAARGETLDRIETIIGTRTDQYGLANVSIRRFTGWMIVSPAGVPSAPPGKKSFCTSTRTSAFFNHALPFLPVSLQSLVRLGGEDEVTLRQSVDLVCPDVQLHLAPGEADIGMMALGLRRLSHAVGEVERLPEVLEGI